MIILVEGKPKRMWSCYWFRNIDRISVEELPSINYFYCASKTGIIFNANSLQSNVVADGSDYIHLQSVKRWPARSTLCGVDEFRIPNCFLWFAEAFDFFLYFVYLKTTVV